MKQIIDAMTGQEAPDAHRCSLLFESETRSKPKITTQADCIPYSIGYINSNPLVKQQINPIVNNSGNNSNNAKTQKLFGFLI